MATPADSLPEAVAAHMTAHHPHATEIGGWTVARDTTDGSAVLAWARQGSTLVTPAVRGQILTRWLDHLHAAGFTGEARTDHSVFDTDRQPDGYTCWLHITGWRAPAAAAA